MCVRLCVHVHLGHHRARHACARLEHSSGDSPCLQPRTFLELNQFLLSLNLPEETRAAWQEVL